MCSFLLSVRVCWNVDESNSFSKSRQRSMWCKDAIPHAHTHDTGRGLCGQAAPGPPPPLFERAWATRPAWLAWDDEHHFTPTHTSEASLRSPPACQHHPSIDRPRIPLIEFDGLNFHADDRSRLAAKSNRQGPSIDRAAPCVWVASIGWWRGSNPQRTDLIGYTPTTATCMGPSLPSCFVITQSRPHAPRPTNPPIHPFQHHHRTRLGKEGRQRRPQNPAGRPVFPNPLRTPVVVASPPIPK